MSKDVKEWTEYAVRCRRWIRNISGKKVWETVNLNAVDEAQARQLYDDITNDGGALEDPQIFIREIRERPLT